MLLELNNIKKYFSVSKGVFGTSKECVKAVDGIDLRLSAGENMSLVGESGCGKSTLSRAIMRLLTLDSGFIVFEGQDITTLSNRELMDVRKHIQMVFQDPFASLNPRMRIVDIVGRPLNLYFSLTGEKKARQVAELLELVELEVRELLTKYEFPGDKIPIVVGSAIKAVEGDSVKGSGSRGPWLPVPN